MITPETLDAFLAVMRKHNVMSANIESNPAGQDRIAVTLGPEFPTETTSTPGGWKVPAAQPAATPAETPSDPDDPDPLGLGQVDNFDAAFEAGSDL